MVSSPDLVGFLMLGKVEAIAYSLLVGRLRLLIFTDAKGDMMGQGKSARIFPRPTAT